MAEEIYPLGSEDATVVTPTVAGYLLRKFRTAIHIADPYVLNARLRLASIGGVYRLPASAVLVNSSGTEISTETVGGKTSLQVGLHHIDDIVINQLSHNVEGVSTTLASDAAVGATQIVVTSATGIIVGTRLALIEDNNFQQTLPYVTAAAGTTLTLDGPLDVAYTAAGTTVYVAVVNMSLVIGTLASPVSYIIMPHATENWDITRMNFSMVHAAAADDSKFGDQTALTNGVIIRAVTALDGVRTLTNMKSNQQIREDMFDVVYSDKAGGGAHGTSGRWSIEEKTGAIIRLNGEAGDHLEVLIQDNLTGLTDFQIKWQGHINEALE